jgi:hypothetical protein
VPQTWRPQLGKITPQSIFSRIAFFARSVRPFQPESQNRFFAEVRIFAPETAFFATSNSGFGSHQSRQELVCEPQLFSGIRTRTAEIAGRTELE